jgi:predicted metal-dependent hydrolase
MGRTKAALPLAAEQLCISGLQALIEVRRHPTARRMTLRVSRTRRAVIVTLPMQCDLDQAGTFLNHHLDWVRRHLGSLPQPVPFRDGSVVPLRGRSHALAFSGRRSTKGVVRLDASGKDLPRLVVSGAHEHAPRRLGDWLVEQARRDLDARVAIHAANLELAPKRIAVRDQSSRWGSCSTTGVLSFSWRLILAPPFILDYVAAHEVAHLAEMNHGPRFWALVKRTVPRTTEARIWLRIYGMDLHRYGQA